MSLESKISKNVFQGNGTTKTFSFTFRVWKEDQVLVYVGIGDETETDVTSSCSITLSENGGTVTFPTAPGAGTTIAVVRNMPFIQEDQYITGARFDPHEIEDRLDQDCAERQQLLEGVGRAVKVPTTSSKTPEQYMGAFWEAVKNVLASISEAGKNIGDSTYVTASGSDTPRTLADRFADIVNVRDFGAVGDGRTDDTLAFKKAAMTNKIVFVPSGSYVVSQYVDGCFISVGSVNIIGQSITVTDIARREKDIDSSLKEIFSTLGNIKKDYASKYEEQHLELESGYFTTFDGEAREDALWVRTSNYANVSEGCCYVIEYDGLTAAGSVPDRCDVHFYDENGTWLSSAVNTIIFVVPEGARKIRLCWEFSESVSPGTSPFIRVTDIQNGKGSCGGTRTTSASLLWMVGLKRSDQEKLIIGPSGVSEYRISFAFVSAGDLVHVHAAPRANVDMVSYLDAAGGIHPLYSGNVGWKDFMWVADRCTAVLICNAYTDYADPDCIIYNEYDKYSYPFDQKKLEAYTGYISQDGTETSSPTYKTSELICLREDEYIFVVSSASPSTFSIGLWDSSGAFLPEASVPGLSTYARYYSAFGSEKYVFARLCGNTGIAPLSYELNVRNRLFGLSFGMLGDSYVAGNGLNANLVSYAKFSAQNAMSYFNYGKNGNTVSSIQETGMCLRYVEMPDYLDIIGFEGGRNDYNNSVPLGDDDSEDTTTFCGALNVLCKGLIEKYLGKKIFGVTSWSVNTSQNSQGLVQNDYNDAFVRIVSKKWSIPVLDARSISGVYMRSEAFREKYCMSKNDVSHLNEEGHALFADVVENFIYSMI